ncbi:BLUF domain-containing protein [Desertivirga arenae]|uniref:BLUF domain-containing protein n=1 Tax=Desertivirga arenae TaxID=2810309 RepID=UPI001A971140|nr:BLUF domain-containing protein [Pedobacter sp. SYSU D00823]
MAATDTEVWCMVFVSSTIKDTTPEMTHSILETVRKERREANLSGLTIFAGGNNLILVEGEKAEVYKEYEQAKKHPAHHSMIKLYDGALPCRFFEDSPLALKVIGGEGFRGLDSFITEEQKEYFDEFLTMEHAVARLCKDFIRNNT